MTITDAYYDIEGNRRVNIIDPFSKDFANHNPTGQKYTNVDFKTSIYDIRNSSSDIVFYN